jgi:hypothetical protein
MTTCGHTRHVGTCPACQRAQLDRWGSQLREASASAYVSPMRAYTSDVQWNPAEPTASDLSPNLTTT